MISRNLSQKELKIFIGYDSVETVAWHALVQSIIAKSSIPLSFHPIALEHYKKFFDRPRDPKQSNSFSFSRFLVPYLADYSGWAIYMDCDMMIRCDISDILEEIDSNMSKAALVVQHDYNPENSKKYLNTVQYAYPRKNWSSFVAWNCEHEKNRMLTPEYVENATGLELHRFLWLEDAEIGELDLTWNWLVGEYKNPSENVRNVHWTLGGPYFHDYQDSDFSEEWFEQREAMLFCKDD